MADFNTVLKNSLYGLVKKDRSGTRLARQAPSLYGATEGSASEAADVETKRFG